MKEDSYYQIAHSFKETIYIPYIALSNNIVFSEKMRRGEFDSVRVKLSDCFAEVLDVEEVNVLKERAEIEKLYKCNVFAFIDKWYAAFPQMSSLYFWKIKLKKIENE